MEFKDLFSGHADAYRASRPTYPPALFAWLAEVAPDRRLAWDAGCGNGQSACALARHFERVVATDPSARQIAAAAADPRVEYRVEPAESSSLETDRASVVTVAQALHWFKLPLFFAELERVLEPGGVFATWSYADCRVNAAVDRAKDRAYVDLTGPYWLPERELVDSGYATIAFPFHPLPAPDFKMIVHWDAAQFLAYLRSWSASQRYLEANGRDPIDEVEAEVRAGWGDPHERRAVQWDFHLRALRKPAL